MKIHSVALYMCLVLLATPIAFAASVYSTSGGWTRYVEDRINPDIAMSSSSSLPDAPDAAAIEEVRAGGQPMGFGRNTSLRLHTGPFSQIAIGSTLGVGGLGFQVATSLATKINLRLGASMLNYSPTIIEEGIPISGAVRLRSANVGVDLFPYRGSFHITPGVTLYNGNRMTATTFIAGGQGFTINDTDYTSDLTDPVRGSFDVSLGKRLAPSLTVGFGNMLKRSSNWTVQTDFGVQYVGQPKFTLTMTGSVCDPTDGCTRIQDDPGTVQNLQQEQVTVNQEIQVLRFYPILSTSVSYRFGHKTSTTYWR
jgi:hypothetical protein